MNIWNHSSNSIDLNTHCKNSTLEARRRNDINHALPAAWAPSAIKNQLRGEKRVSHNATHRRRTSRYSPESEFELNRASSCLVQTSSTSPLSRYLSQLFQSPRGCGNAEQRGPFYSQYLIPHCQRTVPPPDESIIWRNEEEPLYLVIRSSQQVLLINWLATLVSYHLAWW